MARARNIKPGFFANEYLVELPFEYRLLFIGLWTLADREGRLEDRPKRIKMAVFPADNVDVNGGLDELEKAGFLCRYESDGMLCIQILNFSKHQNPHVKEVASTLPAPCKHGASTVQDTTKDDASHADSLIPDSLFSDSMIPGAEAKASGSVAVATVASPAKAEPTPMEPSEIIFGYGVPFLTASGSTDKQARSFLGGLRKQHGDTALIDTLRDCMKAKPLQPVEWLAAALPPKGARGKSRHSGFENIDYRAGVGEDGRF